MATYKKPIYCDFEFLKKVRNSNGCFSTFGSNDAMKFWLNTLQLLLKSKVQLNIDTKTFLNHTKNGEGDTFSELWKRVANGECEISFLEDHNTKFYENKLASSDGVKSAYLINEKVSIANHNSKKYGVVIITPDCWQDNESARKKAYLFMDNGWAATKGEHKNWSDILRSGEYKLSECNSMVIIDNYIAKSDLVIEKNLYPILKELLPCELNKNTKFHLTIMTKKSRPYGFNYNELYNALKNKINELFPNLKLQFDLYLEDGIGEFHDRAIITNNAMICCDGGFDLINSRGKMSKHTKWSIVYQGIHICEGATDVSYYNLMQEARKLTKKLRSGVGGECYPKNCDFNNRLLDLESER